MIELLVLDVDGTITAVIAVVHGASGSCAGRAP